MMQLASQLGVIVGGILIVAGIIALLPVGLSSIDIAKHGAKRVRNLDASDNIEPGQVARSGGRTLLAIGFAVGGLGLLFLTVIIPLASGTPIQDIVWVRLLRFLINLVGAPLGFTI